MSIKQVKYLITITQIARIWSRNRKEIKILQSLTALGFLALFLKADKLEQEKDNINQFNETRL